MFNWLFGKSHPYVAPVYIREHEARYCSTCAVIHKLPHCPTCGASFFQEDLSNLMPWNREKTNGH